MSQASILKDLRNEKTNNLIDQNIKEKKENITNSEINNNQMLHKNITYLFMFKSDFL